MPKLHRRYSSNFRINQGFGQRFTLNQDSPQAKGLVIWVPTLGYEERLNVVDNQRTTFYGDGANVPDLVNDPLRGQVRDYDKANDEYLTLPDLPLYSGLAQATVSCWMTTTARGSGGEYPHLICKNNWSGQREFRFRNEQGNNFIWHVSNDGNDPGGNECTYAMASFSLNTWYHICGTYDGTNLWLYVNGQQVDTNAGDAGGIFDSTANFAMGSSGDGNSAAMWPGKIDDGRVRNRCLSAAEVWQEYDPATRWDLYKPLVPRMFVMAGLPIAARTPRHPAQYNTLAIY